jgi:predicted RNA binding protein YcfA (HicA-like mRNA interferase family)
MPHKYPILKPEEVIKILKKNGFSNVSQKGSHRKYSDGFHVVIVPMHDTLARGTLMSIIQQSGLSLQDFIDK